MKKWNRARLRIMAMLTVMQDLKLWITLNFQTNSVVRIHRRQNQLYPCPISKECICVIFLA